jgi:hypothetical protein
MVNEETNQIYTEAEYNDKTVQTNNYMAKVDYIIGLLNSIPQGLTNGVKYSAKTIGSKIWAFGDSMAGYGDGEAPITQESLLTIDQIYTNLPDDIPIFVNMAREIRSLPLTKRGEYILNNANILRTIGKK